MAVLCTSMKCISPIRVSSFPFPVPCGHCPACLANKRLEWVSRIKAELRDNDFGLFITLTYDNEHLPIKYETLYAENDEEPYFWAYAGFEKKHLQDYFKRVRKSLPAGASFRYIVINEYGDRTGRPHYHGIFFFKGLKLNAELYDLLDKQWFYGLTHFGGADPAAIAYITKYIMKKKKQGKEKTFVLSSRKPAIGSAIMEQKDYFISSENLSSLRLDGTFVPMPRIFRDKLKNECSDELKKRLEIERDKVLLKRQQERERIESKYSNKYLADHVKTRAKRFIDNVKPQTML